MDKLITPFYLFRAIFDSHEHGRAWGRGGLFSGVKFMSHFAFTLSQSFVPSVGLYSTGFWRFLGFFSKMNMESSNFTKASGVEKIKPYVLDKSALS